VCLGSPDLELVRPLAKFMSGKSISLDRVGLKHYSSKCSESPSATFAWRKTKERLSGHQSVTNSMYVSCQQYPSPLLKLSTLHSMEEWNYLVNATSAIPSEASGCYLHHKLFANTPAESRVRTIVKPTEDRICCSKPDIAMKTHQEN
jgi:hypothetical protein